MAKSFTEDLLPFLPLLLRKKHMSELCFHLSLRGSAKKRHKDCSCLSGRDALAEFLFSFSILAALILLCPEGRLLCKCTLVVILFARFVFTSTRGSSWQFRIGYQP